MLKIKLINPSTELWLKWKKRGFGFNSNLNSHKMSSGKKKLSSGGFRAKLNYYIHSGEKKHVFAGIAIIGVLFGVPWHLMTRGSSIFFFFFFFLSGFLWSWILVDYSMVIDWWILRFVWLIWGRESIGICFEKLIWWILSFLLLIVEFFCGIYGLNWEHLK